MIIEMQGLATTHCMRAHVDDLCAHCVMHAPPSFPLSSLQHELVPTTLIDTIAGLKCV